MQQRGAQDQSHTTHDEGEAEAPASTLTQLMVTRPLAPGRHRADVVPHIPVQNRPVHDGVEAAPTKPRPAAVRAPLAPPSPAESAVPITGRWRASHLSRTLVVVTLVMAALGTALLAVKYAQSRSSDDLVSLVIAVAVVVVLWALVIASTPQVVTLEGSFLSVHNLTGTETFDLADPLQPVDVVGDPHTSHWAILLHRMNRSTIVLRAHDVKAAEVDTIVRHYRRIAGQRGVEREDRFNR